MTKKPLVARTWHPTKNTKNVYEVGVGTRGNFWWICTLGHEWKTGINSRPDNGNCPICEGRLVLAGFNDLGTLYPELVKEWHPTKNNKMYTEVSYGSSGKVWWVCKLGHEWKTTIGNRTIHKTGCGVCSGQNVYEGFNDLGSKYPHLISEWHQIKNKKTIRDYTPKSNARVWWKCSLGHEWLSHIYSRTSGSKCIICSNRKVLTGFNDLQTKYPELAAQYANINPLPSCKVVSGGAKKHYWECKLGHIWLSKISARLDGNNCPICSNKQILLGFNDLVTTHPILVKEWHPTKNSISSSEVVAGTDRKIWWLCKKGHEWKTAVYSRALYNYGCPDCSQHNKSKVEQAFHASFKNKINIKDATSKRMHVQSYGKKIQIDIVGEYEGRKIAIEYDGLRYHRDSIDKDKRKTLALLKDGYVVIRIRENTLDQLDIKDDDLFQVNHKWSLDPSKIEKTTNIIIEWLTRH